MFKFLLAAVVMTLSSAALADRTQPGHSDFENSVCYNYHRNPTTCNNLWYCEYNYRSNLCLYVDDDTQPRSCASYDYDPYLCNTQSGCRYDSYSRRCRDDFGPGPGPGPGPGQQCWYYNNDPRLCDRTAGCSWDRRTATCQDDWNPNPDPIGTQTVNCSSGRYRYQRCQVRGEIVSAHLLQQRSSASCIQGRTWGYDYDSIWVDQGCQGTFKVRVRSGYNH